MEQRRRRIMIGGLLAGYTLVGVLLIPQIPFGTISAAMAANQRMVDESQGKFAAVDASYKAEIKAEPSDPAPKLDYAGVLMGREQYDEAVKVSRAALANADTPEAHTTLSGAYAGQGYLLQFKGKKRHDAAQPYFKLALAEDPNNAWAHYGIGDHERHLAKAQGSKALYRSARRHLEHAIAVDASFGEGEWREPLDESIKALGGT